MFEIESCVRGFHVYGASWSPYVGEILYCVREFGNREDPYAVAVQSSSNSTVGHVPRKISCVCSLFLCRGGRITCSVTGQRRRSEDLPQGGLEIPCSLVFEGSGDLEEKARHRIKEIMQCILLKKLLPEKRLAGISRDTTESEEPAAAKPTEDTPEEPVAEPTEDLPQEPATEPTEDLSQEPVAKPMKELSQRHQPNVLSDLPSTKLGEQTAQQPQPSDQWLRCQDIVLTFRDRHILTVGELLEDQHLNFAQRLIKMQFPLINGLRLTVLQNQAHSRPTSGALQIMHIKGNHWIVAASESNGKTVRVYDSLYSSLNSEDASIVQTNFRCRLEAIQHARCQRQKGGSDCGPFAIAMATSLAFGEDPSSREYLQEEMRSHIVKCFENCSLELFS